MINALVYHQLHPSVTPGVKGDHLQFSHLYLQCPQKCLNLSQQHIYGKL